MPPIELALAVEADEPELRRLLRENPMPGRIQVSFECEPNFFAAAQVEGPFHQTISLRDDGQLVGMVTRSLREVWRNGQPGTLGYYSQMRLAPGYHTIPQAMARVGQMLQRLDNDRHCDLYLTSIIADNQPARRLLTSRRPGFANLQDYTQYHTLALYTGRKRRPPDLHAGLRMEQGRGDLIPAILACLEEYGRRHQFSPRWTAHNLFTPEYTPGLRPEDFWLALDGERVLGCLALWDQTTFKQTVVRGYAGWLGRMRPLVNALSPLTGYPRLPAPNAPFHFCFASHLAVAEDDPAIFMALLHRVHALARVRSYSYVMLGLDERHPWLAQAKKAYPHIDYTSQLYLSSWQPNEQARLDSLDHLPVGIETALL